MPGRRGYAGAMQGTVAGFEPTSRSGHLLTDQGRHLDFTADALAEHVRHLRAGQRVFVELDGTAVTSVRLWR
jgi:hypothetical protein